MSEVLLPIVPAPMTSFQHIAFSLAVLLNHPECLPWFYSNFIQLEYFTDQRGGALSFVGGWITDIPWIEYQYMKKEDFIRQTSDLQRSLREFLSDGWYFYSLVDEFYVPKRVKYNKVHSSQDFLLFGFNDQAKEYSILGYSDRGIFEATRIGYDDFQKAFESTRELIHYHQPCVILYKKRADLEIDFNLKYIYDMFFDYVNCRNTSARLGITQRATLENRIFGVNCYDHFINYLQMMYDRQVNHYKGLYRSARSLHVLWEHKKCMLLRLEYLYQQGWLENYDYFYNFFQKLENEFLMLRNTQVKYSLNEDRELLAEIMNALRESKKLEAQILQEMLEIFSQKLNAWS
ncbi:MAG: hypothetical protein K6U80_17565 [Firmicutes bacterium]|nr:hypothetical protein [Bacillota bacterium]